MTAAKAHVADLFAADLGAEDMNPPAAHDDPSMARPTTAPAAGSCECEHPGTAGRGGTEPETAAGRYRVGPEPRPLRQPRGPPEGTTDAGNHLGMIAYPARDGIHPIGRTPGLLTTTYSDRGIFNTLGLSTNAGVQAGDVPTLAPADWTTPRPPLSLYRSLFITG